MSSPLQRISYTTITGKEIVLFERINGQWVKVEPYLPKWSAPIRAFTDKKKKNEK